MTSPVRNRIGRLVAAAIVALLTLLAAPATEAIAFAPAESLSTYAYDAHHHPVLVTGVVTERGPPVVHHLLTTRDAVDPWSSGAFACSDEHPSRTAATHKDPARPVKVARAAGTTSEPARALGGDLAPVRAGLVAAKGGEAAADAANVLKGPIADAIPRNLPEQLALGAAREGQGTIIMRNLGDAPRLVANYGEGEWVKMQYVLRGTDSNVTVHYFRNLTNKMDTEFKFK